MDIYEKRRINLIRLMDFNFKGYGRVSALAKQMSWNPSRASALTRKNNPKNIGEQAARLIEHSFDVARGWLDENPADLDCLSVRSVGKESLKLVPLLRSGDEIARWTQGAHLPKRRLVRFPRFPIISLTSKAYVIEASTNAMNPIKPGDFYYINPESTLRTGVKAAFLIDEILVVGVYEKGIRSDRLVFDNKKESSEEVRLQDFLGVVVMSLML